MSRYSEADRNKGRLEFNANMSELHARLAANIRELARLKGYSLERLADFAGMSGGYLYEIANLKKSPSIRTLEKIATVLEVDVADLLKRKLP